MAKKSETKKAEPKTTFETLIEKAVAFSASATGGVRVTRYNRPDGQSGEYGQVRKVQMKGAGQPAEVSTVTFPDSDVGRALAAAIIAVCDEWDAE